MKTAMLQKGQNYKKLNLKNYKYFLNFFLKYVFVFKK